MFLKSQCQPLLWNHNAKHFCRFLKGAILSFEETSSVRWPQGFWDNLDPIIPTLITWKRSQSQPNTEIKCCEVWKLLYILLKNLWMWKMFSVFALMFSKLCLWCFLFVSTAPNHLKMPLSKRRPTDQIWCVTGIVSIINISTYQHNLFVHFFDLA